MTESAADALICLAHLGEPGDQVLGAYVRKHGPVATVAAIKSRKSGLRDAAAATTTMCTRRRQLDNSDDGTL